MTLPNRSTISKLIKKWQKRLGLSGWELAWQWDTEHCLKELVERDMDWVMACTEVRPREQRALIHLSSNVEWEDDFLLDNSLERTIVHELLHVRFWPAEEHLTRSGGAALDEVKEVYVDTASELLQEAESWKL